jgi:5-methylcytosine-specific restriction protein A
MPARACHPCAHPGCTTLVAIGSRCPAHTSDLIVQHNPEHQRLYDRRWRQIRKDHLSQNPWCANGLRAGVYVAASDVHHVDRHLGDKERFYYGPFESLCQKCHAAVTAYEIGWTNTPPSKMFCQGSV